MLNTNLLRYLIVGGFAYLIEMGALFGLRDGLGLSPLRAVAISFWVGLIVAFFLQKFVTFKNYDKSKRAIATQLIGYAILVGWNYIFTLAVVKLFENHFSVFIIRTIAILIITSWNFFIYQVLFKLHVKNRG